MASSCIWVYFHSIVESHITDPGRSKIPVLLVAKGLPGGLRKSRMKHNTLLRSPGGEWTFSDCCQTAFRTQGKPLILHLDSFWQGGFN